ncbi:hypothetical protein QM012_008441 [Aureobasidium pullulans]|uniref:Uncharacterized protein n=1 Tax=Aureobasidium pullulans TaxID=5580 RepID=A0ABR0TJE8_AURPU
MADQPNKDTGRDGKSQMQPNTELQRRDSSATTRTTLPSYDDSLTSDTPPAYQSGLPNKKSAPEVPTAGASAVTIRAIMGDPVPEEPRRSLHITVVHTPHNICTSLPPRLVGDTMPDVRNLTADRTPTTKMSESEQGCYNQIASEDAYEDLSLNQLEDRLQQEKATLKQLLLHLVCTYLDWRRNDRQRGIVALAIQPGSTQVLLALETETLTKIGRLIQLDTDSATILGRMNSLVKKQYMKRREITSICDIIEDKVEGSRSMAKEGNQDVAFGGHAITNEPLYIASSWRAMQNQCAPSSL